MAEQQTPQAAPGPRPIIGTLKLDPKPHLVASKCGGCGALFLDLKRLACSKCGATGPFQQVDLSTKGKVWVFSVVHQSFPGIKTPYVTVIVRDLWRGKDGPQATGNLVAEVAPHAVVLLKVTPARSNRH